MQKSLIICMTPLQAIIAERIISYSNDKFDLLYIAELTSKNEYYFSKLNDICEISILIEHPKNLVNFFQFKSKINRIREYKYKSIYAANIDRKLVQYLFTLNINANFFSFDDGVGNIIAKSSLHNKEQISFLKKIFWLVAGVRVDSLFIKNNIKKHYTIFNNMKNIVDNTEYISLFNKIEMDNNLYNDKIRVFLGQPMSEVNKKYNRVFISELMIKLKIDYYFPHPREENLELNIEIVHTPKIFEDYIVELVENKKCKIEVYSFFSTAIINLAHIPNIELKYICDDFLISKYKSFYEIARGNFKIDTINIQSNIIE
ncbi:glycosyltransferase family 52 [Acinetobacter baumannii]|uniref:glycosyltransferase family 52 n=1 Tax=Acinetobacter baumannii TaxID=470 RepID=UPI002955FC99|nr:glycosyltransferase family 52 [Acinetobacter baumannii]